MSTYELDDGLVRAFVSTLESATDHDNLGVALAHKNLGEALQGQLPIPVPTKIGAVVRTESGDVFTLTSAHRLTDSVWIAPNGFHAVPEAIGRITEVLSEGVDL